MVAVRSPRQEPRHGSTQQGRRERREQMNMRITRQIPKRDIIRIQFSSSHGQAKGEERASGNVWAVQADEVLSNETGGWTEHELAAFCDGESHYPPYLPAYPDI
ncbi:hypothetical protein RRF57_011947 [Xylaria bambusicola]|uniref:Uncharacterized protein n=1 Tax=Xylaria bambusicola TaxID=326684 RepID=A0AAN7UNP9_9PEZI